MTPAEQPGGLADRNLRWRVTTGGALLMMVLFLGAIQFVSLAENRSNRALVEQSYQRDLLLERLLSLLQDAETSQRGYSLTGREDFLQPLIKARPQIAPTVAKLEALTQDPGSRRTIAELKQLSDAKLRHSDRVIAARRTGSLEQSAGIVRAGQGKMIMDAIRVRIAELRDKETRDQNRLLAETGDSDAAGLAWTIIIESFLLSLVLLAFLAYLGNVRRLRAVTRSTADASRRQAAIFDAASDAMLVADESGTIEGLNPAAEALFVLDHDAMLGRPVEELFAGGDLAVVGPRAGRAGSRPGDPLQTVGMRGDGSHFEAEIATSTVVLEDEVLTLLVVRDATERNRVERMKTQFISTVSHELRTPLTSIRGAISLLDHDLAADASDARKQLLGIAKGNSERLSRLIDDILDIEKIGAGSLEFDLQPIDLRGVVHDAEVQNRTFAADRKVRLIVTVEAEPLPVSGDSGRLLQALTNLIANAAKFSPEGGVVSVVAERLADVARVTIADQGPGIPAEFRPRMFERFSQAHGKGGRAGTGLGLAITKEIVERHGGSIGYQTAIGKGTRFWIDLPLIEDAA